MSNPTAEERNARTFAFLIICDLVITILMRGVNTRFDVPHLPYIGIGVICGLVGIISLGGFIYSKMNRPIISQLWPDILKIVVLSTMTYFIAAFTFGIIINL